MHKLRFFLVLGCLLFQQMLLWGQQEPAFVSGEILVRLSDGKTIDPLINELQRLNGKPTRLHVVKQLSRYLNIWQLSFDAQTQSHQTMLEALWGHHLVRAAQNNHLIAKRNTVPNDPLYAQQWQYDNTGANGGTPDADIDAPEAWDITQGGLTAMGDTIVVCVIDDGLDPTHTDFAGNMWFNYTEIPNNNIDDDNNGFVDDFKGWNTYSGDDDISSGTFGGGHGSSVAGIVGARGDNGIGVTGVNWYVKLMIVVGGGDEARALEAYEYPLALRKRYNQTNGNEGAFVVATNASWGKDNLHYTNAPLWCAFYDTLGAAGILNAGATTNNQANVDVVGDMPTSCPSDYMVAVTNLNKTGNKSNPAGYGLTTVDLGAFGDGNYTTAFGNTYAGFSGTSGAAPQVAGTIGLLYAVPCSRFIALAKADPAAAALAVRGFILNSVVPNASLQNITVTGGTLNLKNAVDAVIAWGCSMSGCHEPFGVAATAIQGNDATLHWWGVSLATNYTIRYREQGAGTWMMTTSADTFATLTGLMACTNYEVEISGDCDTTQSMFSTTFRFKTGDCCYAPTTITEGAIANTTADFSWNADPNVNTYTVEYKELSAAAWTTVTVSSPAASLSGLAPCTDYLLRIISSCNVNVNNEYSTELAFRTKGCGACEDSTYCTSQGNNASYEWIGNVAVGSLNNTTNSDDGYGDYTGTSITDLAINQSYPISLTVDRASPSTVNWRVWMDFNQNGSFETPEKVFESLSFSGTTTTGNVAIPATAALGITRMRVSMRYSQAAGECATFDYGEVEDYCVNITNGATGLPILVENKWQTVVYPNPFDDQIHINIQSSQPQPLSLRLESVSGQNMLPAVQQLAALAQQTHTLSLAQLPAGVYFLHLQAPDGSQQVLKIVK